MELDTSQPTMEMIQQASDHFSDAEIQLMTTIRQKMNSDEFVESDGTASTISTLLEIYQKLTGGEFALKGVSKFESDDGKMTTLIINYYNPSD